VKDKKRLRELLEGVKELKQQYHISSASALAYLRSRRCYCALWENVKKQFPSVRMTLHEFTNLLDIIARVHSILLRVGELSAAEFVFQARRHHVYRAWAIVEESHRYRTMRWRIDYAKFSRMIYEGIARGMSLRVALLECIGKNDEPYFLDVSGAKSFTQAIEEIRNHQRVLRMEGGKPQWFLEEISEDFWDHGKSPEEIDVECREERKWYVSKEDELETEVTFLNSTLHKCGTLDISTADEQTYLFHDKASGKSPLKRSQKEQTRNCLETERRFALATFTRFLDEQNGVEDAFSRAYKDAIASHAELVAEQRRKLEVFIKHNIQCLMESSQCILEDKQYLLLCLKKNKQWLKRVTSR
jgi:hypothetical protein